MDLDHDAQYFLELQTSTGWGQILESFTRWCSPQRGQRALDIGTGPGLLPVLFARQGAATFGADFDFEMFTTPLHPDLIAADAAHLPFPEDSFQITTASNILYLVPNPVSLLAEIARVTAPNGAVCLLNPSEHMTIDAATALADQRGLDGLARHTLVNFAQRAEEHFRWSEANLLALFTQAGLTLTRTTLRMGDGLIRYGAGQKIDVS